MTELLIAATGFAAGTGAFVLVGGGGVRSASDPVEAALARIEAAMGELPLVKSARDASELARRRAACLSDMPVFLDVVTLGLSAGLSFDSSLELYCEQYHGILSQMFQEALLSWRMGLSTRDDALHGMANDLGVSALERFASVVGESLAFGTSLTQTLEDQARAIRDEQRSQLEEEIERVPVKMLIPMGTLIVPALFLAILGPLLGSALTGG